MAPQLPMISVIIPAYKQAAFLHDCLDAVAAQDYAGELEILVVDDGSPDDSAQIAAAHPCQPRVLRQSNRGVAAARNRGIHAAQGEYLAFCDADDLWLPQKLSRQMQDLLPLQRPALGFCRYQRRFPDDSTPTNADHPSIHLRPSPRRLLWDGNFIGCSGAILHRDCIIRAGTFPENTELQRGGQDYALWLKAAAFFPLVYTPEILVHYTVHPNNRVGTNPIKHLEGALLALEYLHHWSPQRFLTLAGAPLPALLTWRCAKTLLDLLRHPDRFPHDAKEKLATLAKDHILPSHTSKTL